MAAILLSSSIEWSFGGFAPPALCSSCGGYVDPTAGFH